MEGSLADNIDDLVEQVRSHVESPTVEKFSQDLYSILEITKPSEGVPESIINTFLSLLATQNTDIITKTAKVIAEVAKCEEGREKCTNKYLVMALIDLLNQEEIDVLIQICRALANIYYENENGKDMVENREGLKSILRVLKKSVTSENMAGASSLRRVATGLFMNFLIHNSSQSIYDEALRQGTVPIICSILEIDGSTNENTTMQAVAISAILNDATMVLPDERLTKVLMNILAGDASMELLEICLELIHRLATNSEDAKLLFAKSGVCELLLKLLEKHSPYCSDEETRSILKIASDVIIILSGSSSMEVLYDNSNGAVYKQLVEWLLEKDKELQLTAAVAMCNFASKDAHCKLMVDQNIHCILLKLLGSIDFETANPRLPEALLNTLRNLAILGDNKPVILKAGLIGVACQMLHVQTFSVIYNLLGTLRIAIAGQSEAATNLGRREDVIKRTVEWCDTNDHPGVQGEANRLIARLISNSRDKEVVLSIIKHGSVRHLVKMLLAEHELMQNEALIGLTILTTICLAESEKPLIQAKIGETLCNFFNQSTTLSDILLNAFSFLERINNSDVLREHLRETGVIPVCQKQIHCNNDSNLQEKYQPLFDKLG